MTRAARALTALVVLAGLPLTGCRTGAAAGPSATASGGEARVASRLVLVSSRDDHGLVAAPGVALRESPTGRALPGLVADGTLARVVAREGTWLDIRTLDGPAMSGWVDDFYLRGSLRLVGDSPACSVTLGGHVERGGELVTALDVRAGQVLVRVDRDRATGWVARAVVRELPPQPEDGCRMS